MVNDDVRLTGVGRSGTTFISLILKEIDSFEKDSCRTTDNIYFFSDWTDHGVKSGNVIITYRDFRDILVSRWKLIYFSLQDQYDEYLNQKMTKDQIDRELEIMRRQMDAIDTTVKMPGNNILLLQYEKFYCNFDYIFKKLSKYLDYNFSDTLKKRIIDNCSIESNIIKMKKQINFSKWSGEDHIHGHHISYEKGRSVWETYIPKELHNYATEQLKDDLMKWNYYRTLL